MCCSMDLIESFVDDFDGRCNPYISEQTYWYGFIMLKNDKNFSIVYETVHIAYEYIPKASIMLKSIHEW